MADLAELLGQLAVAERLIRDLEPEDARIVRLTGEAGSGKSHVAREVAAAWRDGGGAVLFAVGDDQHSWRELFPLLSGLSGARGDWAGQAMTGARSAVGVADAALGGAGAGTTIFDLLNGAFRQRVERALKPYSGLEREVILDLRRLARSRRLLVVAENAHWWDELSLRLLADILSTSLRAIPNLDRVIALLVDTADEQHVVAPQAFDVLSGMCDRTERLSRCPREVFPDVLRAFGATQTLSDDVVRALYSATEGHLTLAEQVARYLADHAPGSLLASSDEGYLSALFARRVASLGASSPDVAAVLLSAAVLGLHFHERDLLCMAGGRPSEVRKRVEQAESIGLIERTPKRIEFSHEVIRSAILGGERPAELRDHYAKLADCLAILRPGDYAGRAEAELRAESFERARDLVALAGVAQLRRSVPASRVLLRAGTLFPDDADLAAYLQTLASGYEAAAAGDYAAPMARLRTPQPTESTLMAAERNYLAALCSMELQTTAGFRSAYAILSSWAEQLEDEVELHLRFLLLLQQTQVLLEMFDEARATELRIEQQLHKRAQHDTEAAILLQVLNRRASSVNEPQVAIDRIRISVEFFRQGKHDAARDQLELYRSLNNLAACEIRLGRDADGYAHAEEAVRVAADAPDVAHRLDVLANNVVLAGYRSGAMALSEAINRQRVLIASPEGSTDKFIHRCNLAAYLLLGSRDDEASAELEELGRELHSNEYAETFLVFHWNALSVTRLALHGELEEAARRHASMDSFARAIRWPNAPYVRRRQLRLAEVLSTFDPSMERDAADRLLIDLYPSEVGPAWSYYGRLMICGQLNFWSDS